MALKAALALDCSVRPKSRFARKNYFYPDLPKGYQISQYETPVVQGGNVQFFVGETAHRVQLTRAHLEEDAGKSIHGIRRDDEDLPGGAPGDYAGDWTGVDLNRAGVPLLEVVSAPVLYSPEDAVAYMRAVHNLVRWLGISDGNMQEGSFRCDANVSVRPRGREALGTRAEIKNVNSFRFVEKALHYEIERQIRLLEDGKTVEQETRLYDPAQHRTRGMRGKESAHDYR